jgi:hypothetical protein
MNAQQWLCTLQKVNVDRIIAFAQSVSTSAINLAGWLQPRRNILVTQVFPVHRSHKQPSEWNSQQKTLRGVKRSNTGANKQECQMRMLGHKRLAFRLKDLQSLQDLKKLYMASKAECKAHAAKK